MVKEDIKKKFLSSSLYVCLKMSLNVTLKQCCESGMIYSGSGSSSEFSGMIYSGSRQKFRLGSMRIRIQPLVFKYIWKL